MNYKWRGKIIKLDFAKCQRLDYADIQNVWRALVHNSIIRLYHNVLCRLWPLINSCSPHHCHFLYVHTVFLLSVHKIWRTLYELGDELINVTCVLWYGAEFVGINIIEIPGIVLQITTKVRQDVCVQIGFLSVFDLIL